MPEYTCSSCGKVNIACHETKKEVVVLVMMCLGGKKRGFATHRHRQRSY